MYKKNNKSKYDILALEMEDIEGENQMIEVYSGGELVYDLPSLKTIRERTADSIHSLNECHRKIKNPEMYEVEVSKKLLELIEEFDEHVESLGNK